MAATWHSYCRLRCHRKVCAHLLSYRIAPLCYQLYVFSLIKMILYGSKLHSLGVRIASAGAQGRAGDLNPAVEGGALARRAWCEPPACLLLHKHKASICSSHGLTRSSSTNSPNNRPYLLSAARFAECEVIISLLSRLTLKKVQFRFRQIADIQSDQSSANGCFAPNLRR